MTDRPVDMHKAAGTIIVDRKFMVERSRGKSVWGHPGGKLEPGETAKQALVREFKEEFNITVQEADLEFFGTFYGEAARNPGKWLRMDVFTVKKFSGSLTPSAEVDEYKFINSTDAKTLELSSICQTQIIPRLQAAGLID